MESLPHHAAIRVAKTLVALAGPLLLVGCGGNSHLAAVVRSEHPAATASAPASRFNDADVMFTQQMILHHQQAIQMARMAVTHAQNPKVKALAAKIQIEAGIGNQGHDRLAA